MQIRQQAGQHEMTSPRMRQENYPLGLTVRAAGGSQTLMKYPLVARQGKQRNLLWTSLDWKLHLKQF